MALPSGLGDIIGAALAHRSRRLADTVTRNNAILRLMDTPEMRERNRVRHEEYLAELALLAREYGPPDMNARSWHLDGDDDY